MSIERGGVSIPVGADLKPLEKGLKKAEGLATGFSERIRKAASGAIWDGSSFVAGLRMSSKEFDKFIDKTVKAKEEYQDLIQLSEGLKKSDLWSQLGDSTKKSIENAVSVAGTESEAYDRTLKNMGRGQKLKGLFDNLKAGVTDFSKKTAKAGSDFGLFLRRLVGIGSVALLVRKAFSMATEGLNNLAQYDSRTQASLDSLRNALMSLKNALGAAFAPIVNFVAPILTKFINMLTKAANSVAHFFGALTGQKEIVVATDYVGDSVGSIGDNASAANDRAKELKRTLMGFDKINKLDGEDEADYNPSPSMGTGGGGGQGFTTVPISGVAENWADKFREMWEKGDFTWLGKTLAEKLNKGLESINWTTIKKNCKKVATSIGTFINGFVENFNWGLLGHTISEGIKTALDMSITFLRTVNWESVGKAIVDFICGIDWLGLLGKSLVLMWEIQKALVEVFIGAVRELGKKIGEIFQPIAESIRNWFAEHFGPNNEVSMTISLKDAFTPVWDKVKDAWNGVVSSTVVKTIKGAIAQVWYTVKKTWDDFQSASITKTIKGMIGSTFTAVKNAWNKLQSMSITKTIKGAFGSLWNSVVSAYNAIKDKWVTVTIEVQKIGDAIGDWWDDLDFDLDFFASGGNPQQGQLFFAREDGPELVGTLGGHSAVMNNDQIVSSVASGVAQAMNGLKFMMNATPQLAMTSAPAGTESSIPAQSNTEVIALLRQLISEVKNLDLDVTLDGESIKNNTVDRINNHTRSTGQLEIVM